jgi:hypothetical protein
VGLWHDKDICNRIAIVICSDFWVNGFDTVEAWSGKQEQSVVIWSWTSLTPQKHLFIRLLEGVNFREDQTKLHMFQLSVRASGWCRYLGNLLPHSLWQVRWLFRSTEHLVFYGKRQMQRETRKNFRILCPFVSEAMCIGQYFIYSCMCCMIQQI